MSNQTPEQARHMVKEAGAISITITSRDDGGPFSPSHASLLITKDQAYRFIEANASEWGELFSIYGNKQEVYIA